MLSPEQLKAWEELDHLYYEEELTYKVNSMYAGVEYSMGTYVSHTHTYIHTPACVYTIYYIHSQYCSFIFFLITTIGIIQEKEGNIDTSWPSSERKETTHW